METEGRQFDIPLAELENRIRFREMQADLTPQQQKELLEMKADHQRRMDNVQARRAEHKPKGSR